MRVFPWSLLVVLLGVAACGAGDIEAEAADRPQRPEKVVARVGDTGITLRSFNRWLRNAKSGQLGDKKRSRSKRPRSVLRDEVMDFLVQGTWVQLEAKLRGVTVSERAISRSYRRQKKQAFPREKDYKRFLRESGMSVSDIRFRVRLDLLQTRVTKDVVAEVPAITEDRIEAEYERRYKNSVYTLDQVRGKLRRILKAKAEQRAIDGFVKAFRRNYKRITACQPGYFRAQVCGSRTELNR